MRSDIARIFVSSTWLDLQPERRAVEDAINRMSAAKFIGMEYFGSRPESTEGASLDEVDAADLYLGIIAGRYGSGITEAEYRRARERKLPCFIYFKTEAATPAEWRETDPARAARLAAFKKELLARHIVSTPFKTSEDLAVRVRDDLYRWFFNHHLAAKFALTTTGSIITSRDDQRVLRLDAGSEYGGVIYNGEMQKPRPRPAPARPSVRPFRGLLDRVVETDAALTALHSLDPVEFYGQPGIGKTALLRHLAYRAPNGQFGDGAVYLEGVEKQPTTDLLQFLFDSFYESEPGYKPREGELLNLLRDKRALILMDDVKLSRTEIERVMNAAPECAFLLSGPERHLFGEGRAMQMPGLPEKESLQLLERELGRMLEPEEQSAARAICSLLQGHPLHLAQAAALVGERPLAEIAVRLQASREQAQNPAEVLNRQIAAARSDNEKRVLAALAALNGSTVRAESLAVIAGQDDIGAAIDGMLQCKLIEAHGDGYRLNSSLQAMLQNEWELTPWRQRALDYFTAWAERHQQLPGDHKRIQEESAALLALFNWAVQTGRHREAIRLGKAMEGALILGGRWEAWGQVLQQIGQAAEESRDREAEAWVLHQQGTRAVCLGNDGAARELLTEALEMRAEMGDHAAASVTRHNLDWLFPPVPFEPPHSDGTDASEGSSSGTGGAGRGGTGRPRTGWLLKFGGAALLAGLGGWLWWPEAKAQFAPGMAQFSSQPLNQTSEEIAATLVNSTSKELAIDDLRIDGAAAADFKIVSEDCRGRRLSRGENCSVRLFFQPQTQGAHQAVLRLIGSPGDLLPELKMTGATLPLPTPTPEPRSTPSLLSPTPVASPSNAASPAPGPRLEISPGSLTFPARQVKTSDTAQVTLINRGTADLKINDIWIAGPYRRDFSVEPGNCRQRMIQPNGSCTVSLSFTPSDEGDRGATLIINSNDAAGPLNVPVTGAGLRPTPTATPTATPRPTPTATPRPTPINPARIYDFSAESLSIVEGKETRLCYSMGNVVRASISPSIGGDLENLSRSCVSIRPKRTTTFTLMAFGGDGQQTSRSATVQVVPPPQPKPPVIYDFSADPSSIPEGNGTRLCYSMGNVARASISPSIGGLDNLGRSCVSIGLKRTTTFTLAAFGGDGRQTSRSVTVQVMAPPPPPKPPMIYDFSANPSNITEGNETRLCYSMGNVARASISPSIGGLDNLGRSCVSINPKRTTTFTLAAFGGDGQQMSRSVTVQVTPPPQPKPPVIHDFSANPSNIAEGNETKLCYSMDNVARASISPSIGGLDNLSKSCIPVGLKQTTTFTLTAFSNDGQQASSRVAVQVIRRPPVQPPRIFEFFPRPASIVAGNGAVLCYSIGAAARASISPEVGELRNPSKDCVKVSPKRTTTYTLFAGGTDNQFDKQSTTIEVQAQSQEQPPIEKKKKKRKDENPENEPLETGEPGERKADSKEKPKKQKDESKNKPKISIGFGISIGGSRPRTPRPTPTPTPGRNPGVLNRKP